MKNQKHKLKIKNTNAFFIFGLCFLFLIFSFSFSYAQTKTLKNIGFIQNNIWYSKDPFFEGDKIRIYTAVFNGSQYDFRGTLEFFVYGKSISKSNFSLVSGAFQVLWADWTAEGGSKKIYANIIEPKISLPSGVEESVVLENTKTGELETFIDKDTDKDGIGDKSDSKDDRVKEQKQVQVSPSASDTLSNEVKNSGNGNIISQLPDSQKTASAIKQSVSKINNFLDEQKNKAEAKKEELQKKLENLGKEVRMEVEVSESPEGGAGKNKNLLKLYLLALSALIFSLEYKVIIYLFGIYIAYRILKFFMKKIFF